MTDFPRCANPVFIIGTERSGSNLLRLILEAHSAFAIPHPPHFMHYLAPLAASYGELAVEANRSALAGDALRLLRAHIHPWEHPIDEDELAAASSPSVFGVVAAIYEQYRRLAGAKRWGCKSTFMVDYVGDVTREYPRAQFIWLVRDPRDVAASAKRSVFSHFHPLLTAKLWVREQELAAAALDGLGPRQVHLLRYEELVAGPREQVLRLCEFLGESFEEAMLEHHRLPAAQRIAGLSESWSKAGSPIDGKSVGRHTSGLTDLERRMVEQTAAAMMDRLGYAHDSGVPLVAQPSALRVQLAELLLRLRAEARSMRTDKNHWRRWRRNATVSWLRLKARARPLVRGCRFGR